MGGKSLLVRTLRREAADRRPVWLMRQAGRYLPEYQKIRQKHDFLTMIKTPSIAAEVTLQPVEIVGVDAAILFSDILVVPEAMGMELSFDDGQGPRFASAVGTLDHVKTLRVVDPSRDLGYVLEAIGKTRNLLRNDLPLIGFSGAPWTLAAFMVEGKSPRDGGEIKRLLYTAPDTLRLLLSKLSEAVASYLKAQIDAGVDAIQIFDTLAGNLSPEHYREFGLAYIKEIIAGLRGTKVPIILFAKGQGAMIDELATCGADCLGVDWQTDIGKAKAIAGGNVALQGNLDPAALYAAPETIRRSVVKMLERYGKGRGYVVNLGHGVPPTAAVEHVKAFVKAAKEESGRFCV